MRLQNRLLLLSAAMLVLSSGWPVHAEGRDARDEGYPASSVARLIVDKGTAWVLPPDSGDWQEFQTNTPIAPRTRINIPEGSESELEFHNGQYMLLTGGSEIDIRDLTDERSSFRLKSGEIRFDLSDAEFAPVRVALPGGGFVKFPVPGKYWLTVVGGGDTRLVVRRGEGTVTVARGDFTVREGEEATVGEDVRIGPYAGGAEQYAPPPPLTDHERRSGVPPTVIYELNDYGEWITIPTYGVVWRPRVVSGWSPYYYGTWTWISPFGWTWVSYEPWGWWPYHYGWWYSDPFFGWVWCPFNSFVSVNVFVGRPFFFTRATFFPATVRFVPEGRRVRWVPLRPGERFVRPSFRRVDNRLTTWDRPLARGAVLARVEGKSGTVWRDWREVRRGRSVVVRTEGQARIQPPGRRPESGLRRDEIRARPMERGTSGREARPAERNAPQGQGRIERQAPPFDRPGRVERQGPSSDRPERVERQGPSPDRSERVERQGSSSDRPERIDRQPPSSDDRPGRWDRYDRGPTQRRNRLERHSPLESGRPAVPPARVVPGRQGTAPAAARERRGTIRPERRVIDRPRDYGDAGRAVPFRPAPAPRVFDGGGGRGAFQSRAPEAVGRPAAPPSVAAPRFDGGGGRGGSRPFVQQREGIRGGDGGGGGMRGGFNMNRGGDGFRGFDRGGRDRFGGFGFIGPRGR